MDAFIPECLGGCGYSVCRCYYAYVSVCCVMRMRVLRMRMVAAAIASACVYYAYVSVCYVIRMRMLRMRMVAAAIASACVYHAYV